MLRRSPRPFRVALVVPLQGSAGIYGPSCVLCARLAVEQIGDEGGVLGREVALRIVDGATGPRRVAAEVDRLVAAGAVDAVVGWHLSAVRELLAPCLAGRVPYVFTALYEGGESTRGCSPPARRPGSRLSPALRWMATEIGVHRWMVIGNDYVWPRRTTEVVRAAAGGGVQIDGGAFVGLGSRDFGPALQRIEDGPYDGVLMLLVGRDSVEFSRQFAARGLRSAARGSRRSWTKRCCASSARPTPTTCSPPRASSRAWRRPRAWTSAPATSGASGRTRRC